MRHRTIRRIAALGALLALAGCANYDRARATAPNASTYELCMVAYTHGDGTLRQIAFGELQRRSGDCGQYANAIATTRAANAQSAANALAFMRAMQPPPAPAMQLPPPPVHCTSYNYGNQVSTTCR